MMTQSQSDKVIKEGWIFKESKHIKNYRKRFMQLKKNKLLCYKTDKFIETHESPTEIFNLLKHKYRIIKHNTLKQTFYLINETTSNSRKLKALSELDRDDWVYKIRNSLFLGKPSLDSSITQNDQLKRTFSICNTFESEIESKHDHKMQDSESENSDDDFGGYTPLKNLLTVPSQQPKIKNNNKIRRKTTISARKSNQIISQKSFHNFRIRSLT
eukprot:383848_1